MCQHVSLFAGFLCCILPSGPISYKLQFGVSSEGSRIHNVKFRSFLPVLLLGEDWDARRLKDCDLHQSAVCFYWLPIIIGYHK